MASSPINRYAQFHPHRPLKNRLREVCRDTVVCSLGILSRFKQSGSLRFPYYHHVYDDEREGFVRQLRFLSGCGEFISLDSAITMLESGVKLDGHYFCITFDDGLAGCRNAVEILGERHIPATFYVTTDFLGRQLAPNDADAARFGFKGTDCTLDFLSWDDCRRMVAAGMTIGSHTCSHAKLAECDDARAEIEMTRSKARIETETGTPCLHFCAPWGKPDQHYRSDRDPALAQRLGYRSFASGVRGSMVAGDSPYALTRDHFLANWSPLQMRYFLSRP